MFHQKDPLGWFGCKCRWRRVDQRRVSALTDLRHRRLVLPFAACPAVAVVLTARQRPLLQSELSEHTLFASAKVTMTCSAVAGTVVAPSHDSGATPSQRGASGIGNSMSGE